MRWRTALALIGLSFLTPEGQRACDAAANANDLVLPINQSTSPASSAAVAPPGLGTRMPGLTPGVGVGSVASRAGQQPAMAPNAVPLQKVRSILFNKRTPPTSGPAVAPFESVVKMSGLSPVGAVLPPMDLSRTPQTPRPVSSLEVSAPRPAKLAPSQEHNTGAANRGVPQVRQKTVGDAASASRQQPTLAADTAPLQPIPALISSGADLQTAPVRPIPSLLSESGTAVR
jgi:hypothetical protein